MNMTYGGWIARSAVALIVLCACREQPAEPPGAPSLRRAAAMAYTAVDLGTLGGQFSYPEAISPAGQVVGASETANGEIHAFLWEHGAMIDLLHESYSWAMDISSAGRVVGMGLRGAFLWEKGVTTELGGLGRADAINNAGAVAGMGETGARVWRRGSITDIGSLGGGICDDVADINPRGQVVGTYVVISFGDEWICHGFLWENGKLTDLGTLGGENSVARGINSAGQVVGYSQAESGEDEAFLWENGVMRGLGTLSGGSSYAWAITPGGEVLGESSAENGTTHAFLWKNGVMTDLGFLGNGVGLAINPRGQIVGASWESGYPHATLWTPR